MTDRRVPDNGIWWRVHATAMHIDRREMDMDMDMDMDVEIL